MREILFRGKWIVNGEWVEGGYCKHDKVKVCFTTDDPKTTHLILKDGSCDWGFEPSIQVYEVDPATVGQYTGLKDKNGKRIFEGDILQESIEERRAEVKAEIHNCNCCHAVYGFSTDTTMVDIYGDVFVIGNIHDNPEYRRNDD